MKEVKGIVREMVSRHWWWSTVFVIIGVAVTIRLGLWQLDRLNQRRLVNQHIRAMQAAPAINLSIPGFELDQLAEMEYRLIRASGRYDFDHQVAIRNQFWQQNWGIEAGYALLTPLILDDGRAILVQRGWIPASYDSFDSWRKFDEPGEVFVEGIVRLPREKGELGGGVPDPPGEKLEFWNFVNITRIEQQLPYPLLDVYIQQAPDGPQTVLPFRSLPEIQLNDGAHLGYAIQWFFYGSILLVGYPIYIKKNKKA